MATTLDEAFTVLEEAVSRVMHNHPMFSKDQSQWIHSIKNTNKQKIFLLIHSAYEHEHGAYESHDH